MRIGVVSDTHDHPRNVGEIVRVLERAGVDRIVHTGDITRGATLEILARVGVPLFGVYGNNDVLRDELDAVAALHGITLSEPPLELEWAERRILVVHDPRDIHDALEDDHALVLHGHTHLRVHEEAAGRLVFNPGECAGHLEGHNAVGVVEVASLRAEIVLF